jgi:hypothetical protein
MMPAFLMFIVTGAFKKEDNLKPITKLKKGIRNKPEIHAVHKPGVEILYCGIVGIYKFMKKIKFYFILLE